MTIKDKLEAMLVDNGFWPDDANGVVAAVMLRDEMQAMAGRWDEPVEAYPATMLVVLWTTTKAEALAWIDKNMPRAWFRPMFEEDRP